MRDGQPFRPSAEDVKTDPAAPGEARAGLCATCEHLQLVRTAKASVFYRCLLSEKDPRFRKYPVLPVRTCAGYERKA